MKFFFTKLHFILKKETILCYRKPSSVLMRKFTIKKHSNSIRELFLFRMFFLFLIVFQSLRDFSFSYRGSINEKLHLQLNDTQ